MRNKNIFLWALCVAIVLSMILPSGAIVFSGSGSDLVLVSAPDGRSLSGLSVPGAEIVYDYGSSCLIEADASALRILSGMGLEVNDLPSRHIIEVGGYRFDVRSGDPVLPANLVAPVPGAGEESLYLVHFIGPIPEEWKTGIESAGAEVVNYVPNFAYEVIMTPEERAYVEALPYVDWVGFYHPAYKLSPDLTDGKAVISFSVPSSPSVLSSASLPVTPESYAPKTGYMVAAGTLSDFEDIARRPDVHSITHYSEPRLMDEVGMQIVGGGAWAFDDDNDINTPYRAYGPYGAYVNQLGYNGTGVTVGIADTGLGDGTTGDAGHLDFTGRVIGGLDYGTDGSWNDEHGHGTHCAGLMAADGYHGTGVTYAGFGPYYVGMGLASNSEIYVQQIFEGGANPVWVGPSDYYLIPSDGYAGGARVHSNSWGSSSGGAYGSSDQAYDTAVRDADSNAAGNQEMVLVVAAGNDGSATNTIGSPGNAKNIITVGSVEDYMPDAGSYGNSYDSGSDPDAVSSFSSRGWTDDGRIKPDVMAPGQSTLSTHSSIISGSNLYGLYSEDSRYEWCSGTSQATPTVSGGAAVVYGWYQDTHGVAPSPALVKGLIINTAIDMGIADIPNQDEGWGRMFLPTIIDPPAPFLLKDQISEVTTGVTDTFNISYVDSTQPLKITLVYTDTYALSGDAVTLKNQVNLEVVSPSGAVYHGNAFSGGWTAADTNPSATFDTDGDGYDDRNNVECVYIPAGSLEAGTYTVRVIGFNVPTDADNDGVNDQDYALIMYNAADNTPPEVTLTYPVGGEIVSGSVNIQWTATDADGDTLTIDLYYSNDSGSTWTAISLGEANDGSYLWDTSLLSDGVNYMIRVDATDPAPITSSAISDPFSIDNILDDQWFLQIQAPGVAGYQNLSMEPVELANNEISSEITDAGQYLIGGIGWMTHSFADSMDLSGTWTFNVWGHVTDGTAASGYLYAKVYKYDGVSGSLLYTTINDDENISLFETPHLFTWSDAVTGTLNAGDSIYVEFWLDATSGSASSFIADYANGETNIYGTQTGTYLDTTSSDNVYEVLTEDAGGTLSLLNEDFESGVLPSGWSHAAWDYTNSPPDTLDEWAVGTPSGTGAPTPYSGSYCAAVAMAGDYSADQGSYLESPPISIPAAATGANLSFWLYSDMEASYDGLNLKISVNGGPYQNVTTSVAYDDTALSTSYGNPIGGEAAWCGDTTWRNPVFDILSVAAPGDTVQFRWHFGSDSSVVEWGPAVDDVLVTADVPTSFLEHKWTFDVTGGGTGVTFAVEAYHSANTEGDDFTFAYSTDDITYFDMLNITKTADDDIEQTYALPSTLSGTVYVKVVDIDRTAGNTNTDSLYIDRMVIRTETGAPQMVISYDYATMQSNVQPSLAVFSGLTFDIPVQLGWNLISYPLLVSGSIETVLNDDVVWDYAQWYTPTDTLDPWKTHVVGRTLNDLNTIDNTYGLWLHVTDAGDGFLTVSGNAPTSTTISLYAGWNLVSYPSSTSVAMDSAGLPVEVTKIGQYDATATYLVSEVADWTTTDFVPGQGYWLYATADTTWTVSY